jgi:hypothetical protein
MKNSNELLVYFDGKLGSPVNIAFDGETLWLTRRQIAKLFQTTEDNVRGHIKNIYKENELDVTSTSKKIYGVVENRPNYGITPEDLTPEPESVKDVKKRLKDGKTQQALTSE